MSQAPGLPNSPPDKPAYRPYPVLAAAVRAQSTQIVNEWRGRTLFSLPELSELTVAEFENSIASILAAMADALESNDPPDLRRLMETAPAHGFQRFMQDYDLADLFAEERVLRRVIVARVEESLGRQCGPDEAATLHAMIDIMLQQGVLALVQQQKRELRQAAEVQLRHLSYLSHDLSNNFFVIAANLEFLKHQLDQMPEMREAAQSVGTSLAVIRSTREGMRRLLEHERLRNTESRPDSAPVGLLGIVETIVKLAPLDARSHRPTIDILIDPQAAVRANADLVTIILQNLIGNAVKHASAGGAGAEAARGAGVRVEARREKGNGRDFWTVRVIDHGPGIPKDELDRLFNAFERRPQRGEKNFGDEVGFGLGLAIASHAARLLGTNIEVETQEGHGSTFSFRLVAVDGVPHDSRASSSGSQGPSLA